MQHGPCPSALQPEAGVGSSVRSNLGVAMKSDHSLLPSWGEELEERRY